MNTMGFLLFSVLGVSCIALLQVIDTFTSSSSFSQYMLEWAALDIVWSGLLIFSLYQHHSQRQI
ncbi:hypothetical protein [Photobacterium nomapromontoriensis]|uniref:hypothetical protein n=1 Tax=Photobacterium nomapromontoriensis TaxID=2910237 RepID=UPI003D09F8A0